MRQFFLLLFLLAGQTLPSDAVADGVVAQDPAIRNIARAGVNLGVWTSWGAEQLPANVLKNPGFEGVIDRAIVVVGGRRLLGFADDTEWLARSAGFWEGGTYQILTGRMAGSSGTIIGSGVAGGRADFQVAEPLERLAVGDVIAVTRIDDRQLPTQWWIDGDGASVDLAARRPESGGRRSLRLGAGSSSISYLDAIGERAGILLPLNGAWTLSVWARADGPEGRLRVQVIRSGTPAFLDAAVPLDGEWREYRWLFRPADTGKPGTIAVRLANGAGGTIWLDDASLRQETVNQTGFRDEVVKTLRTLRPGYLRDWQGQLGDTLANRLAPAHARRASRYRPGGAEATDYGYGLEEFLKLAHEVDAAPWIVLPPVFTPAEWAQAGAFLRAKADEYGFREVLVEFGNENWNELFRPAGIVSPEALAEAAQLAFARMLDGAGNDRRIRPVLGGSFFNVSQRDRLAELIPPTTILAVAPYWAYDATQPHAFFPPGHSRSLLAMASRHETAIYEMNAHSLNGTAPPQVVNEILTRPAVAAAMAWHTLGAMEAGVERTCIYTLAGYDTLGEGTGRLIQLFGITQDLAAANHFRPEGEALALLNSAIRGDYHPVASDSPDVRIAAFASPRGWRVVLVSKSASALRIRLVFPHSSLRLPTRLHSISSLRPGHGPNVVPRLIGRGGEIEIPPFGILLATPEGNPNDH